MWRFALVLAVLHAASCTIPSTYWILETLKCSEYRVILSPNKNLVETPEALDQMCRQQDEFYLCLELMALSMKPSRASELYCKIASERAVFNGLCTLNSPWRRRYLECAHCINMQQTDFCRTPEFLGVDGTDPSSPCPHVKEKIENCIAATLSLKCGVEAGQLFQYLLKQKGYDICHPVKKTFTNAHPSSDGNHSTESAFGEIIYQLVKKIGYIPEQDSEESFVLHKRVGHLHKESESVDENISSSLEIENSNPYSQFMEFEDSENVEHDAVSEDKDSVSEVTTSVDETSEDFPRKPDIYNQFGPEWQDVFNKREELIVRGPHSLPSRMKDRMRRSHAFIPEEKYETFRVFPDGRINYYSRRRDIHDLETIKCYNFRDYFVCIYMPRSKYPRCLETTVFTGPREGEFFPEEFDPEFGAQWYKTMPKETYLFEPWTSVTKNVKESYVTIENRRKEDMIKLLDDVGVDSLFVSTDVLSLNKKAKFSDVYEFMAKKKRARIVMGLFQYFTSVFPSISRIEIEDLVPQNIVEALANLYESKRVSFENVKIRLDDSGKIYIFWYNHESVIDTITCGKVNKCHPKGEGIWKCVIVPRPPIEIDDLDI